MRELVARPSVLYDFPKTTAPEKHPIVPVVTAPLDFPVELSADAPVDPHCKFRWILGDFGRCRHSHVRPLPRSRSLRKSPARFLTNPHTGLVQPCGLRPPEVVLGLPWGPAVDIWSLGCLVRPSFSPPLPRESILTSTADVRVRDRHAALRAGLGERRPRRGRAPRPDGHAHRPDARLQRALGLRAHAGRRALAHPPYVPVSRSLPPSLPPF